MSEAKAPAAPAAEPATPPPAADPQKAPEPPKAAPKAGEKPGEPAKPETPPARSWAALQAAEQRQRKEREALAAERAALAKEREQAIASSSSAALETFKQKIAKGDYEEVAKELGLDYKAWTTARINQLRAQGKTPGAAQAQTTIDVEKQIRDGIAAEMKRRDEEAAKAREENETKQWSTQWSGFVTAVKGKPEGYELLAAEIETDAGHVEAVLKEMSRQAGSLTYDEAARLYEAHLVDRARRLVQIPKVKALYAPEPASPAKPAEQTGPRVEQGQANGDVPRTITNALAATSAGAGSTPGKKLSKQQALKARLEKEAALFRRPAGRS